VGLDMAEPSEQKDEHDTSGPTVGALLQASRQRLGEELTDVASMLRIRLPYLVAIEAGRHQELPGATYAVGFIRAYAEYLGLDSEEVVRRFKAETTDGGEGDRKLSFPTPVPEMGIPGGAYVFIGLVIAVLGYGTWYISSIKDGLFVEQVSPLDGQKEIILSDDKLNALEKSKSESGSGVTQDDALVATLEKALVLSDDKVIETEKKLIQVEKSKSENGSDAVQADVLAATLETTSVANVDKPSQIAPDINVESIVSIALTPSEPAPKPDVGTYESKPNPALEPDVKKFSTPKTKKINVEKSEEAFVKPAEVEKAATVGEDPPKAVVESKPSPKPELKPQPEEMNSGVLTSVGLGIEIEVASAELATTATPIPIKTVSSGSSRIKINAINNSWIQIRDDNSNTMLVTRLLAAGDSFAVPDKPGLVLLTGNAGALEIVVDDTIVPSIGGPGIVRRGVVLDVGRLKAGTAVSN